jgi:CRP-like cAMP-binding protein
MPIPQHNQNLFSSTLSSGDFALLEPDLTTIEMRAGDSLHRIGEQVQHVVLPHSGLVAMTLPLNRGTSMEVALIGREGVVGGFLAAASVPASSNAEVRIPGSASRISAKAFCDAFARSVSLQMHVSRFNNALMAQVQQSALCNAVHVVDARLCRWLLEMQDRSGDKLPLMQKSLARLLGVRRTTVTVAISKLRASGVLECRRGRIRISNRATLERYACECYSRVRHRTTEVTDRGDTSRVKKAPAADSLSFRCPETHRLVFTRIAANADTLARTRRETIVLACPHCGAQHTAKVSDVFIAHVLSGERFRGETGVERESSSLVERMITTDGGANDSS